jgi:type III secretion protein V
MADGPARATRASRGTEGTRGTRGLARLPGLTGAAGLALFVVAVVAMMIVPLPRAALDVLLTTNLGLSVALLLAAVASRRTLDLSTFPTVLVLATLFRLALNVSTVRLILLQADAGRVVQAFGAFVVRGDYVVGFAVFLILTIVQYVVISRGAERVAEVAARFSLDAMPGAQLAIDAEARAGHIGADEARRRRAALGREAQLYGALDGAMRFVKGDAIAGIIILVISLVGGLAVGVLERGMPAAEAARLYTLLTIGDGLVSQLPALLVSTAAGLVVTRVASAEGASDADGGFTRELAAQLGKPRPLLFTAGLLLALALVPGLPMAPFVVVAALAGGAGWAALRRERAAERAAAVAPVVPPVPAALEVALHPTVAAAAGPALAERLGERVRAVAGELGLYLPGLRLVESAALAPGAFSIRVRGVAVSDGLVPEGRVLAEVGPAALPEGVEAEPTEHPATGALASLVPRADLPALGRAGVPVLDAEALVAVALEAALRRAAPDLLGLDETQRLLDETARVYPALVREVVPKRIDVAGLADVLRRLVAEGESVRDLRDVLEAIARLREPERDPALLVERVRGQLARALTAHHARDRRVEALTLDADAEEAVRDAVRGDTVALEPDLHHALLASLGRALEEHPRAVVLAPSDLRRHLRRLVAVDHPRVPILAYHELLPDTEIERVATLRL